MRSAERSASSRSAGKAVARLAAGASSVALKGGEVVGHAVATMSSISESSKRIVDLISVIDSIAPTKEDPRATATPPPPPAPSRMPLVVGLAILGIAGAVAAFLVR